MDIILTLANQISLGKLDDEQLNIASMAISVSALELALLNDNGAWSEAKLLFKGYVVGSGIMAAAIFSIPRLWLIRLICNSELPHV